MLIFYFIIIYLSIYTLSPKTQEPVSVLSTFIIVCGLKLSNKFGLNKLPKDYRILSSKIFDNWSTGLSYHMIILSQPTFYQENTKGENNQRDQIELLL